MSCIFISVIFSAPALTTALKPNNQTVNDGVAHSKNPKKVRVSRDLTFTLSTPWMYADLESIVCKFGGDPAICLREEAIYAKVYGQTTDAAPLHYNSFLE